MDNNSSPKRAAAPKPILFLDFDRTLFDTTQLLEWLGVDVDKRIGELVEGKIEDPDFASMLYPDTLDFLREARRMYRLVLLTYSITPPFQQKKILKTQISRNIFLVLPKIICPYQ